MKIKSYRDLAIWKLGKELVTDIYRLTVNFPKSEFYGMVSQLRRAAVSVPSNIAEGFNRYQNNEYRRFLYISLGSCAEIETQIEICYDLKYIQQRDKEVILEKIDHESKMIMSLIKKL